MPDIRSRPYNPNPEKCCLACTFDLGTHSTNCSVRKRWEQEREFMFENMPGRPWKWWSNPKRHSACDACVYGSGNHAHFCPIAKLDGIQIAMLAILPERKVPSVFSQPEPEEPSIYGRFREFSLNLVGQAWTAESHAELVRLVEEELEADRMDE